MSLSDSRGHFPVDKLKTHTHFSSLPIWGLDTYPRLCQSDLGILYSFAMAAVTNYHKHSVLKQFQFIFLPLCRSEVQMGLRYSHIFSIKILV